jgi:paraquat-inducible protein B
VLVKAKIAKHAAGLMVADAKVLGRRAAHLLERRVRAQHAPLGQLHRLSGGQVGESQSLFFALDEAPVITDEPGRQFVLKTPTLGSLGVGTPIYYRRLNVGQVTGYTLAPTASRSTSRSSSTRLTTSTSPPTPRSGT